MPIGVNTLRAKHKFVIKALNALQSTKEITPKASSKYTRSLIKQFNRIEDVRDNQSKNNRTGLVKVSSISNNRARQSDPRLACLIFHEIAQIYIDIREQES